MKRITVVPDADLLSSLPNSIIETILGYLPLRDVVRTSILSREWRYKWASCPEIVFDFWFDQMFLGGHKLDRLIQQILELHRGPLLKFTLQVPDLKSSPEIDQWVAMLPNDTVQDMALHVSRGEAHNLTRHLFTFKNLRNLKLNNCVFDPPLGFEGFSMLKNLDFQSVVLVPEKFGKFVASCPGIEKLRLVYCSSLDSLEITGPKLKSFIFHGVFGSVAFKNCPVLRDLKVTFSSMEFTRDNRFSYDFVKSMSCLPALEDLHLQAYALKDLVEHGSPNKLPISLPTLKSLHLSDMYFERVVEISCAICFIRSCPNLQRLNITAFTFSVVDSVADFLRSQQSSESLTQLKAVKMQLFSGLETEMEFVKYLLASATALEEMEIAAHNDGAADGGEWILNELKQYPRASPNAEIVSSDLSNGEKHA